MCQELPELLEFNESFMSSQSESENGMICFIFACRVNVYFLDLLPKEGINAHRDIIGFIMA